MILVVGGRGAGKLHFIQQQLGYSPQEISRHLEDKTDVLYALEELSPLPSLEELLGYSVVSCQEVGCGVIPMSPQERDQREELGRLCCQLAERAQGVYRLVCGIPMRLK